MRFKKIIKMFEQGNVCVCGLRGTGKDMLTANVVARRKKPYVSNIDYNSKNCEFQELNFDKIDCGKNDYRNLIYNNHKYPIHYYKYPYHAGSDIYISDVGIYFPAQYCSELNRDFKYLPTYFALSRQVSHNNVHINVQNLNRCWDKIREQSDLYIRCRGCVVIFGFVLQKVTIYDKYQSCLDRVEPCSIQMPLFKSKETKAQIDMYLDKFRNTYGDIKTRFLFYRNKSNYDTYYFEKLFEKGVIADEVAKK